MLLCVECFPLSVEQSVGGSDLWWGSGGELCATSHQQVLQTAPVQTEGGRSEGGCEGNGEGDVRIVMVVEGAVWWHSGYLQPCNCSQP